MTAELWCPKCRCAITETHVEGCEWLEAHRAKHAPPKKPVALPSSVEADVQLLETVRRIIDDPCLGSEEHPITVKVRRLRALKDLL